MEATRYSAKSGRPTPPVALNQAARQLERERAADWQTKAEDGEGKAAHAEGAESQRKHVQNTKSGTEDLTEPRQ